MRCAEFEGLWVEREEGMLSEAERDRMRGHVESCADCARLVRDLAGLDAQLVSLGDREFEVPPYLKTRILARVEESPRRSTRRFLPGWINSRRLLAASTACLAFFAGLLVRELHTLNQLTARASTQMVVLEFQEPAAKEVRVVGDFNDWGRDPLPIQAEQHNGRWVFRMELEPGRYQYAYLVDGTQWLPDPDAPGIIPDGFGGQNSLLYVPGSGRGKSL